MAKGIKHQNLPGLDLELLTRELFPLPAVRSANRRQYGRRLIGCPVQYLTKDGKERPGIVYDISPGGAKILADERPSPDDNLICYIDQIGRFAGTVLRCDCDGFVITFELSEAKLVRLINAVESYFERPGETDNKKCSSAGERRGHNRAAVNAGQLLARRSDGETFSCSVTNISLGGIEICTDFALKIGDSIEVGAFNGVIVRKTEDGYGVQRST